MTTFQATAATFRQGTMTLPREAYVANGVLQEEIEKLFIPAWLCAGRTTQVAEPGAYFLFERFGESVIILRDRSGVLRAFHNLCRHRGTRICEAATGRFPGSIQCPYHAWTYSTDGHLLGAPFMQDAEGFDKRSYGLLPVAFREWEGFLFVNLAREPVPFDTAMASVIGRFARFDLPALVPIARREYDVRANWKLIMQNYNECLHCPTIHPELNQLLPYTSGANDLHEGACLGGYMEITSPNESVTITGRSCGPFLGTLPDEDRRRAYYYSFFPNMMLSMHPDYANWYSVWPISTDRSLVICEWMMPREAQGAPNYDPGGPVELWHTVNAQDWHICELSQAGVSSRAYRPGPYSPRESIPAAWDRTYVESMRD
ncbi:MAG: aromatic ring-hydroxylating oxygenase subunit alpha [Gemmatimonadota bacterium]